MIEWTMARFFFSKKNEESPSLSEPTQKKCWRDYITKGRVFFSVVALCAACGIAGYGHYRDPGPLSETRPIVIPQGGMTHVVQTLQDHHVIASGWSSVLFFRACALISAREGGIHAAEFQFPARVSIAHVLAILRHGRPVTHSLTVPEGVTAYRIREILEKALALQGDIPDLAEGSVSPQTFFYRWGEKRSVLLQRMQELMTRHINQVWEGRDISSLQGLIDTPEKMLILASLVERETALSEERSHVARVFLNRLRKGMRLQTDPTVIYALSEGKGTLGRALSRADLEDDSPYNTYRNAGLPPGPICSPSVQSMNAVAHPSAGDDLYFVANGQGGHIFSHSLSEHVRHVHDYRKIQHSQ